MAEMNKRPAGSGRRSELEDDLVASITDKQALVETGTDKHIDDKYSRQQERKHHKLNIVQGRHYRHPQRVLHNFGTINKDTEHAESVWEQAMQQEEGRTDLPLTYKPSGHSMVANQLGVTELADKNFASKKNKLSHFNSVIGS